MATWRGYYQDADGVYHQQFAEQHAPAGSPQGGQFVSSGSADTKGEKVPVPFNAKYNRTERHFPNATHYSATPQQAQSWVKNAKARYDQEPTGRGNPVARIKPDAKTEVVPIEHAISWGTKGGVAWVPAMGVKVDGEMHVKLHRASTSNVKAEGAGTEGKDWRYPPTGMA